MIDQKQIPFVRTMSSFFHSTNLVGLFHHHDSIILSMRGLICRLVAVVVPSLILAGAALESLAAPRNLAAKKNGGTIVWYTSKDTKAKMGSLVDEKTADLGWRSRARG